MSSEYVKPSLTLDKWCCTMVVLHGFGERQYMTNREEHGLSNHGTAADTLEEFKDKLQDSVKRYNDNAEMLHTYSLEKLAIVQAITISSQPMAEKFLEELGFTKVGPFTREKYSEYPLTVWIISIENFLKAIKHKKGE